MPAVPYTCPTDYTEHFNIIIISFVYMPDDQVLHRNRGMFAHCHPTTVLEVRCRRLTVPNPNNYSNLELTLNYSP